jgi:hypothetical protein
MTNIVPADEIEQIVGIQRHRVAHYGRAVSAEQTVYILHSHKCRDSGIDLRSCAFSIALDEGVDEGELVRMEVQPVPLGIWRGRLLALRTGDNA